MVYAHSWLIGVASIRLTAIYNNSSCSAILAYACVLGANATFHILHFGGK